MPKDEKKKLIAIKLLQDYPLWIKLLEITFDYNSMTLKELRELFDELSDEMAMFC